MLWLAWYILIAASLASATATFIGASSNPRVKLCTTLTVTAAILALSSMVLGITGTKLVETPEVPKVLAIAVSVVFAISFGGPLTELLFRLASRSISSTAAVEIEPSLLRGGLWIGLLERTAIVASLWASWPEGIAVVLAVKGLGRFAELKNHQAAEQFILGTFSSGLVATGAYGLGLLLS
ncbi:hypothetical protein [Glutamicibacter sp.]|uniref:hypothetical protein n=1 Tax=Glutamicibacter sp. TaxID=1931995 RepID=UPI0028BF00AA|nr:hypothetical protein [Glutamicibacter sp.]